MIKLLKWFDNHTRPSEKHSTTRYVQGFLIFAAIVAAVAFSLVS